ncbi:MAG: cytochrome c [Polyangiaceae bacterium]|nr:cytochrome c [Polyangiaceae bacterium]
MRAKRTGTGRRFVVWTVRGAFAAALLEGAAAGMLGVLGAGCDRPPEAESLREWTPADHHSGDDDKLAAARAQSAQAPAAKARGNASAGQAGDTAQVNQLVDLAWRQQCATCHGPAGRGDGQMGAMLRATDLTNAEWQGRTSDADIASVIKTGRNRMPRFDLPDAVVGGLVARIRSLRARP